MPDIADNGNVPVTAEILRQVSALSAKMSEVEHMSQTLSAISAKMDSLAMAMAHLSEWKASAEATRSQTERRLEALEEQAKADREQLITMRASATTEAKIWAVVIGIAGTIVTAAIMNFIYGKR